MLFTSAVEGGLCSNNCKFAEATVNSHIRPRDLLTIRLHVMQNNDPE
jgi:hypothetical protein